MERSGGREAGRQTFRLLPLLLAAGIAFGAENDSVHPPWMQMSTLAAPVQSLSIEYTVEEPKTVEQGWRLKERHRMVVDCESGRIREEVTMTPLTDTKQWLSWRAEAWDGVRGISLIRKSPYHADLSMEAPSGTGTAAIFPAEISRPNPFLIFFQGYSSSESLVEQMKRAAADPGSVSVTRSADALLEITIGGNLRLRVDPATGKIRRRTALIGGKDGGVVEAADLEIEEYQKVGGRDFPTVIVYTERDSAGKVRIRRRWQAIPDSVKIDAPLSTDDFVIQLPIGCKVVDNITQTTYIATGLEEDLHGVPGIEAHLDSLLRQVKP